MTQVSGDRLESAVELLVPEIKGRLGPSNGACRSERVLWRELACCVLSSQVPYELAKAAADRIDAAGVLGEPAVEAGDALRAKLYGLLSAPFNTGLGHRHYRFPRSRAALLVAALASIRERCGTLTGLVDAADPGAVRVFMVREVAGLGPKQASMFLRNVRMSYDMAIIDRHVVRYMVRTGLCDMAPTNLSRLSVYEAYENILRRQASLLGYEVGVIDWAIWIVMRAATALETE